MKTKANPPKAEFVDKEAEVYLKRNSAIADLLTAKTTQVAKIKHLGKRFGTRAGKSLLLFGDLYEIGVMFKDGRLSIDDKRLRKLIRANPLLKDLWMRMSVRSFNEEKFRKLLTEVKPKQVSLLNKIIGKCLTRGQPIETVIVKQKKQQIEEELDEE
jgi:hypothetical protein